MLLKWILKAEYGNTRMWTGVFWLRIGPVVVPCERGKGKFGDNKKFRYSRAENVKILSSEIEPSVAW
jgi:hypothetical protein